MPTSCCCSAAQRTPWRHRRRRLPHATWGRETEEIAAAAVLARADAAEEAELFEPEILAWQRDRDNLGGGISLRKHAEDQIDYAGSI